MHLVFLVTFYLRRQKVGTVEVETISFVEALSRGIVRANSIGLFKGSGFPAFDRVMVKEVR